MPFVDNTGVYDRVTEIIGVEECEEKAYWNKKIYEELEKDKNFKVPSQRLLVSHIGTLVHRGIENFIREELMLPMIEHKSSESEIEFEKKIYGNKKIQNYMDSRVILATQNFYDFWNDFDPTPIASEQIVKGIIGNRRLKGEIDFVGLYKRHVLDEYFKCASDGDPDDDVILITDWKTGKRHMKTHKYQLSAYYTLASKEFLPKLLEKYKYYTINNIPIAMGVYLGNDTYKAVKVEVDVSYFLKLAELYDSAERVPISISGSMTVSMKCLFCNHRDKCTLFQTSNENIYRGE